MPRVWKEVFKLEKQRLKTNDVPTSSFETDIDSALYDEAIWGELTPKARPTKHAQIIQTMRQLAKDIKYYDLDQRETLQNFFAAITRHLFALIVTDQALLLVSKPVIKKYTRTKQGYKLVTYCKNMQANLSMKKDT